MSDVISQADLDAFARDAFAAIELVLDQRCPEMKVAFWTAVDQLYRLDRQSGREPGAAQGPDLAVRTPAPSRSGSPRNRVPGEHA